MPVEDGRRLWTDADCGRTPIEDDWNETPAARLRFRARQGQPSATPAARLRFRACEGQPSATPAARLRLRAREG